MEALCVAAQIENYRYTAEELYKMMKTSNDDSYNIEVLQAMYRLAMEGIKAAENCDPKYTHWFSQVGTYVRRVAWYTYYVKI